MPIHIGAEIRRMAEQEFKDCVYEAMRHVFDVHRELGRLFHEKIYQREIGVRIPNARREVPIEVRFENFRKSYYLDLLVAGGGLFEMKAVESLAEQHRRQLMHYLFLLDLPHGKLVNFRSERVEHEFVNNVMSVAARRSFAVTDCGWEEVGTERLKEGMTAVLCDWGVGLDVGLYEEVAAFLCNPRPDSLMEVEVMVDGHSLGSQAMRLAAPGVAIRVTALPPNRQSDYRDNLHRLMDHTNLRAIQWINVRHSQVCFESVRRRR